MSGEQPGKSQAVSGGSPSPGEAPEAPAHARSARPGDALLGRALALVRFLREGCPWDARQTPESLRPYLLEEAHETADAVLSGDDAQLADELGDLLLNVAFQIVLAEERGAFDGADVVRRLEGKMEARHPHVYGDAEEPPDWEEMKARERHRGTRRAPDGPADAASRGPGRVADADTPAPTSRREGGADDEADGPFAGVPSELAPLSRALRAQQRAAALGFDWPEVAGAVAKLREEIRELEELLEARAGGAGAARAGVESVDDGGGDDGSGDDARRAEVPRRADGDARAGGTVPDPELEDELGDLLFAAVNVARLASVHPAPALERATRKFQRRFRELTRRADESGLDLERASLDEMEAVWQEVKGEEGDDD